jgi:hypothetical protein
VMVMVMVIDGDETQVSIFRNARRRPHDLITIPQLDLICFQ